MKLLKWMKEPKKIKKPNEQTDLEKVEFGRQVLHQTQEFFLDLLVKGEKYVIARRSTHQKNLQNPLPRNAG